MQLKKKKILVVDDEQYIREFYEELFTQEGYDVITAANGQGGLDLTLQEKPDLLLLDIIMPDIDGMTVFNTLNNQSITIPVIFLTNAGDTSHLLQAIEGKAAGFFIKSNIEPEDLLKRVKDVLSGTLFKNPLTP